VDKIVSLWAYPMDGGQSSSCIFFEPEPMSENECRDEPYVRPINFHELLSQQSMKVL